MIKHIAAAGALLASSLAAFATNVSPQSNERYQRQYQYAQTMMRLNGIGGELSSAELAKMRVHRPDPAAALRNGQVTDAALDLLADAVDRSIAARRAKSKPSQPWRLDEEFPTRWSTPASVDAATDCANAIEHPLDQPLRIEMKHDGVAWLRVIAPEAGTWAFDTLISDFDTRLTLFRDCRDIDQAPIESSDDSLGLGSMVGMRAHAAGQTWIVKLERKGGLGTLAIAKGGYAQTISGRVTSATTGSGVVVAVGAYGVNGYSSNSTTSSSDGSYSIYLYQPGDYRVRTAAILDYWDPKWDLPQQQMAYPGAVCRSNDLSNFDYCAGTITPVTVLEGGNAENVDFVLGTGATVAGYLTDDETGQPVVDATVEIWSEGERNETTRRVDTDSLGRFRIRGLPSANWIVQYSHQRYGSERWANVECPMDESGSQCPEIAGTPLAIAGSGSIDVSASLRVQQYMRFDVSVDGQIPSYASANLYNANGVSLYTNSRYEPTTGRLEIGPLGAGNYRVAIHGVNAYSKVYAGDDCNFDCSTEILTGGGVSIPMTAGAAHTVALRPLPTLSGVVRDAQTSAPIAGVVVWLRTVNSGLVTATTDAEGRYLMHVAAGTYFVHFVSSGHVDELYDEVPCESDNPLLDCFGGTLLGFNLNQGSRVIDEELIRSAGISGRLEAPGSGIQYAYLDRIDASGNVLERQQVYNNSGRYSVSDLPTGLHRFAMQPSYSWEGYRRQLFDGINCPNSPGYTVGYADCAPASAKPVALDSAEVVDSVDFRLMPSRGRDIRVVDDQTGAALSNIAIDLWTLDGQWLRSGRTNSSGIYTVTYSSGFSDPFFAVKVSTDNSQAYINEIYDDQACAPGTSAYAGSCTLTAAAAVLVSDVSGALYPTIQIRLRSAIAIFSSDFE